MPSQKVEHGRVEGFGLLQVHHVRGAVDHHEFGVRNPVGEELRTGDRGGLIVLAGVLWAFGDIALMLIESNHDLRATRLMVWQLNALMKMRMENEGIRVDPVRPSLDPRQRTNISEE